MPFVLPELPYDENALAPVMSAATLQFHHGKHHRAYVEKANELLQKSGNVSGNLVEIIRATRKAEDVALFNQTAQIWNHSFFWQCLAPPEDRKPAGQLAEMIDQTFGSTDAFLEKFKAEAVGHFSNGWAWLVLDRDQLRIMSFHDADTPVVREGLKPLLTLDLWEHAYYIDYRNARPDFAEQVLKTIINWEFVAQNLDGNGAARADQSLLAMETIEA
jgi:Fe-Mn family superoxide dismutase